MKNPLWRLAFDFACALLVNWFVVNDIRAMWPLGLHLAAADLLIFDIGYTAFVAHNALRNFHR